MPLRLNPTPTPGIRGRLRSAELEIEMVVAAARGVEGGVAGGAARVAVQVCVNGELGAARSADDGWLVPFAVGPDLDSVAGEKGVAVLASVVDSAAFHLDGDDVRGRVVMGATGLGIKA